MWLLAGEFMPLVRLFDRLDVRQKELKRWITGRWSRLPAGVKILAILICVGELECGTYFLISSG